MDILKEMLQYKFQVKCLFEVASQNNFSSVKKTIPAFKTVGEYN